MIRSHIPIQPVSMERTRRAAILHSAWFVVSFLACITTSAQELRSLETDRLALERFKLAVDPTSSALPWVTGTNPCTWTGVQCDRNRIAVLRLQRFNLTGPIPSHTLGDLDQLRILSLHHNLFTGPFPVDITRCGALRALFLGNNRFSGPLPEFAGIWPRLTHFDVAFNIFSGAIPESLNGLNGLMVLELQSNAFTGEIPRLRFASLVRFSVAENQLEGPVPIELQRFPNASFVGNAALCGPPTGTVCEEESIVAPVALTTPGEWGPSPAVVAPKGSSQLSPGATAGIATGAAVLFLALVVAICCGYFCCCSLRRGSEEQAVDKSHVGMQVTHYSGQDGIQSGVEIAPGAAEYHLNDGPYAMSITRSPSHRSKRLQFLDQGKRQEFGLEELLQASAEALGKGGIGSSYKAAMAGDCVMVVKRLRDVAAERKEFETHVEKLGRLRHRHLLPMRAYYFSREEKLLVTDFMPRGSLYSILHGARHADRPPLDWVSREKIALGSARALCYLHKPGVKIAHGDIKSSNILLNRDYEPYLSDYGMTPLLNPATVAVSRFACYRAMEVTDIRKVSMQSDVYSFGVLLLELITGKIPKNEKGVGTDLPRWIMSMPREDWSSHVFDPELKKTDTFVEDEMAQMLQLAVACVDRTPERRPKMDELVLLLEDITQLEASSTNSSARKKWSESPPRSRSRSVSCGPTPLYTRPSSGVFVVD